jgi:thioredoxin reductase
MDFKKKAHTEVRVQPSPPPYDADADVIVVGGGPAGLSAALVLGRANRRVHLFDSGPKRNEASRIQHAVLGADNHDRADFISTARSQVLAYPTVTFHCDKVLNVNIIAAKTAPGETSDARRGDKVLQSWNFEVQTATGKTWLSKKLILATGVEDQIPQIDGFDDFWGKGIYVCLYCDAYEYNGQPLAAYGNAERGIHIALEMLLWSKDVTLFTDGQPLQATPIERELLKQNGIRVIEDKIKRAYGNGERLQGLELITSKCIPCKALFFNTGREQRSDLPEKLGLRMDERGDVSVCQNKGSVECVHGLYLAGNCASAPLKLVITAASQGAIVGAKVNSELLYEELGLKNDNGERKAGSLEMANKRAIVADGDVNGHPQAQAFEE